MAKPYNLVAADWKEAASSYMCEASIYVVYAMRDIHITCICTAVLWILIKLTHHSDVKYLTSYRKQTNQTVRAVMEKKRGVHAGRHDLWEALGKPMVSWPLIFYSLIFRLLESFTDPFSFFLSS